MIRLVALLAVVALSAAAQEHLTRGLRLYDVQQYDDAIAEFRAGYAIDPDPQFLYALGQAQRKKGDCAGAVESYRAYLRTAPGARQAQAADDQIAKCRASEPASPTAAAPTTTAPTRVTTTGAPPRRRVWTWLGLGLTVATAVAATGVEIAASQRYDLLGRTCAPPQGAGCTDGDLAHLSREIDAATGLFVAAGALGVATIVAITLEARGRR